MGCGICSSNIALSRIGWRRTGQGQWVYSMRQSGQISVGHPCKCCCWYDLEIPKYGEKTIKQLLQSLDRLNIEIEKIQSVMDIQTPRHQLEIEAKRRKRKLEKTIYVLTISMSWLIFLGLLISTCWFKEKC
ncbi:hypothetical protein I3843_08G111900 [Carya illinoinensis]|uniref:Uncharacterized protein n=1 Tax=Carya illinoinensis TaxID=32201 RepID=A0A922JAK5_CARIL|nr:hypothetical protein I3760_08G116600 [Carya illinoinensis]KAG2693900.1 hypothetical protein I3760_08G116600 [Carya illinoinensis]KAG6700520.1 hypothetical protein I3842_08G116100 [Carya illinoinensis]KAG7967696.1 hypothetical protein I3843_08G111900 [Carya illinoinensis]KAG7967697.1 hypothetical protein I3843_08G111900 [Carya illinoinensis]